MNNKKLIQMLIIIVAAVWVFCIVLLISFKAVTGKTQPETTTEITLGTTLAETTVPETTVPTATVPSITIDGNNVTTAADVDKPQWLIDEEESKKTSEEASKKAAEESKKAKETTKSNVPEGKKEIINAYIKAVNELKNTKNFTMTKTEKLTVEIDEITGGDRVKSIADQMVKSNARDGSTTYNFANGMDSSTGKSPTQVISPIDTDASLSSDYVSKATATAGSNGSYTVKIELTQQTQTLDTPAPGYATSMEVIDLETLGLPSMLDVTELEIIYDNSYIEAVIDQNGRITSMYQYLEVSESTGKGKLTLVSASIKMHGNYTANYKVSY